jgi:hypothetical protein
MEGTTFSNCLDRDNILYSLSENLGKMFTVVLSLSFQHFFSYLRLFFFFFFFSSYRALPTRPLLKLV